MDVEYQRSFSPGDPGLPQNGLLVGGGGGFTWRYVDFALHANGTIEKLEYSTSAGPIPEDYSITGTGTGDSKIVAGFGEALVKNDFWSLVLEPPAADTFDYVVAVNEKKGSHVVLWTDGASEVPKAIADIRNEILRYAIKIIGE